MLGRAHAPERPDWRILSAQGAVADQVGDHPLAQRYYDAALKVAPGEPTVLSNQGLSFALSKRLPEAEQALRQADAHPDADERVRQNLALVLALQGKFGEAEAVLRRDLPAGRGRHRARRPPPHGRAAGRPFRRAQGREGTPAGRPKGGSASTVARVAPLLSSA